MLVGPSSQVVGVWPYSYTYSYTRISFHSRDEQDGKAGDASRDHAPWRLGAVGNEDPGVGSGVLSLCHAAGTHPPLPLHATEICV